MFMPSERSFVTLEKFVHFCVSPVSFFFFCLFVCSPFVTKFVKLVKKRMLATLHVRRKPIGPKIRIFCSPVQIRKGLVNYRRSGW